MKLPDDLIPMNEAVVAVNTSVATLYRLRRAGSLTTYKQRGHVLVSRGQLNALFAITKEA